MKAARNRVLLLWFALTLQLPTPSHADWPTYQNDASRSGYTETKLPDHLTLSWAYKAPHPPHPAWPRQERMPFDRAYHPVIAEGLLFFGSSSDDAIRALDAKTGSESWRFFTEGPVRFAPAYAKGKLYVVSDDGFLYCLKASTGVLIWKKRGGIDDRKILGNGRMISRTPARGGPVVFEDQVYFAAGIWPTDGIFLHALEAETGKTVWLNDSAGAMYMPQPHGGANANSGISAQGYLVADQKRIYVPTGRAVPASFDRKTGVFQYFHLQRHGHIGGSTVMAAGDSFIHNGILFGSETGSADLKIALGPVAGTQDGFVCATPKKIMPYRWTDLADKKSNRTTPGYTNIVSAGPASSVIVAGQQLILGLANKIQAVDLASGKSFWSTNVEGTVYGLAASDQRLYAGTDHGIIYCFDVDSANQPTHAKPPYEVNQETHHVAAEILRLSGIKKGFCLDLGCGDGRLAHALAQQSELHIIGVESNKAKVDQARMRLSAAGLYGTRITILHGDPAKIQLPDYFANLIVSSSSLTKEAPTLRDELLRPFGGIRCMGKPGSMTIKKRGALKGAGQWTHQYANPANTVCSDDTVLRGPLGTLWFGDLGQQMIQRHGRAPAPLFYEGIIYSEGRDSLFAVDAYNGHKIWEYALPGILKAYDGDHLMGTSGTGGNYCIGDDGLFIRQGGTCLRIDAKTGDLLNTYTAPPDASGKPGTWGYLATANGLLYGSLADTNHIVTFRYLNSGNMKDQLTQSTALLALDPKTGEQKWRFDATYSLRHNAIAISSNYVVLIDKPQAMADRKRGAKSTPEERGDLVALNPETGVTQWTQNQDIYGTVLAISEKHQSIMMSYQPTAYRLASELGGRLSVLDLKTGEPRWEKKNRYDSRPMINDKTIYVQGGAWDLLNGESRDFNFQRSYGCGILAGAKDLMVFRSATLGYFDLTRNEKNEDFGGVRPGCWINVIPAGGLVLAPDASAGCKCSYLNQSWIALQPFGIRAPLIKPLSRSSRQAISVSLESDHPESETIRFTQDGSTPSADSPRYTEPIKLSASATIIARVFDAKGIPGPLGKARYIVDKNLIPIDKAVWTDWDAPGAKPASNWQAAEGWIHQKSNIMVGGKEVSSPDPHVERPGTLLIYNDGKEFQDGTFSFEINSGDNDAVGVAFRLVSTNQYYLWAINAERKYRVLSRKDGETFTLLATNKEGYTPRKTYRIRIQMRGPKLTVFVDDKKDMEIEDATFTQGTIALYCWGNSNVRFGKLLFSKH